MKLRIFITSNNKVFFDNRITNKKLNWFWELWKLDLGNTHKFWLEMALSNPEYFEIKEVERWNLK